MRYLLALLAILLFQTSLTFSQSTEVRVIDKETGIPISFTKIHNDAIGTVISDIDGKITIDIIPNGNYSFRFFMYKDTTIKGSSLLVNPIVALTATAQILDEVTITPGENPAHRIIQNVMNHKKDNDPLKNNSFQYDSYSKLYMTGELMEGVDRDTITDTSAIKTMKFLDEQYIFLTETKATRSFSPPNYDKEVITAYNVSGIKEPIIATFLNQFQAFSFYENSFSMGQAEYINPIAPGGLRRYLFILEDTIFHQGTSDTTYTISFRPRKGKNFSGLSGYLYVNTNGWAIERVIASPYNEHGDNDGIDVRIIQEYKITNNTKWFPSKISTEFNFNNIQFGNYGRGIGRGSLYIDNVVFDQVDKKGFNPVSVVVDPNALQESEALSEARGTHASGKEAKTYEVIDSIAKENNFQRLYDLMMIASTGRIPISVISIPIDRIIYFNDQEGFRLGLGLETNNRLSRFFQVGGYFGYGLKDNKWKWGGDLNLTFHQQNLIRLNLHYHDDLHERGGPDAINREFSLLNPSVYRDFFINKLDRERYAGLNLSGYIKQNIKLQVFGNYRRISFIDDYNYMPLFSENGTTDQFDVAEVGLEINWNIREKVMILEDQRVSLGTKWPKINAKATKGFSGIFDADYDYYRFQLNVSQDFRIRGLGEINLLSQSGMSLGNVPLTLSQTLPGTGRNWTLSVPNTFQTMTPAEFFSDHYTSLFFQFRFLPIKIKTKWTEPVFVLHSAAGVGEMRNITDHRDYEFETPEKGYYESGLTIDNLLKSRLVGIGVGAFYRYGPYGFNQVKDNIFYKFTIRFNVLN